MCICCGYACLISAYKQVQCTYGYHELCLAKTAGRVTTTAAFSLIIRECKRKNRILGSLRQVGRSSWASNARMLHSSCIARVCKLCGSRNTIWSVRGMTWLGRLVQYLISVSEWQIGLLDVGGFEFLG